MRRPAGWTRLEYGIVNALALIVGLGLGHVVGVWTT